MRVLAYFRSRRLFTAELEALRAENARLRYDLTTALLAAWIRRPPKAAAPPESVPRPEPHPVRLGRHHARDPDLTEFHPRAVQRREPLK